MVQFTHFGILAIHREHFDPLKEEIEENPRLSLERLGLDSTDMEEIHFTGNYFGWLRMKVGEIFDSLRKTLLWECWG